MWLMIIGVSGLNDAYKQANREAQKKYGDQLTRGHMNPSGINSFDKTYMKNTFTLANTVPQFKASNSGPWNDFENKIKEYAKTTCGSKTRQGTLYLLTGRSENGLKDVPKPSITNTFTVNTKTLSLDTPQAVWTAGCCVWKVTGKPTEEAESFAVMSNNHYDTNQLHQTEMSVNDLEKRLKAAASKAKVDLFPGNINCARNYHPLP